MRKFEICLKCYKAKYGEKSEIYFGFIDGKKYVYCIVDGKLNFEKDKVSDKCLYLLEQVYAE